MLSDLMNQFKGDFKPNLRTVKILLQKHFGEKLIFPHIVLAAATKYVCFRDVGNQILYDNW